MLGGRTAPGLVALVVTVLAVVATACSTSGTAGDPPASAPSSAPSTPPGTAPERSGPPLVQVSTPLVGALVRSIGGDQVDIEVLLPADIDPTDAGAPVPGAVVGDADLVVVVDPATYETGLADLVRGAESTDVPVVVLAPQLGAIGIGGTPDARTPPTDPDAVTDPHVWLDTDRWTQAGRLVADALVTLDGVDEADVDANVDAFDSALSRADEEIQALVAAMAPESRTVVSDAHALAYLTDRYGLDLVIPTYLEGLLPAATERGVSRIVTTEADPSVLEQLASVAEPDLTVVRADVDGVGLAVGPDAGGATAAYTTLLLAVVGAITGPSA